ncbi:MAG: ATP-grasp domain-containing protein [Clostridia bacterium]|nr:ATP-grasp domain-containing protein [Clostridia bacterium]
MEAFTPLSFYDAALIFGGVGSEREISKLSAKTIYGILGGLGLSVLRVFIAHTGDMYILGEDADFLSGRDDTGGGIPTFPVRLSGRSGFLCMGDIISVGCVIPALHGDFGEDGRIAGLLGAAGLRFVGADTLGGAITQDKAVTKLIAMSEGIPTVPFVLYKSGGGDMPHGVRHAYSIDSAVTLAEQSLSYPVFVKPSGLGSSVGCAIARNRGELVSALDVASELDSRVIIEKYIDVKEELEVAFLDGEVPLFVGPAGISTDGFYDFEKKYRGSAGVRVTPRSMAGDSAAARCHDLARRLVRLTEMRSLCRVDFLLSRDGNLYFNEINSFPGFTDASMYRELMRRCGVGDRELIARLTGGAL